MLAPRDLVYIYLDNLGKPGYAATVEDLLPGSDKIPSKVFVPKPTGTESEKYAWDEVGDRKENLCNDRKNGYQRGNHFFYLTLTSL